MQTDLWELISSWMLQRFKKILGYQLPKKDDNIVFCKLAPKQEQVGCRDLAVTSPSPDRYFYSPVAAVTLRYALSPLRPPLHPPSQRMHCHAQVY